MLHAPNQCRLAFTLEPSDQAVAKKKCKRVVKLVGQGSSVGGIYGKNRCPDLA